MLLLDHIPGCLLWELGLKPAPPGPGGRALPAQCDPLRCAQAFPRGWLVCKGLCPLPFSTGPGCAEALSPSQAQGACLVLIRRKRGRYCDRPPGIGLWCPGRSLGPVLQSGRPTGLVLPGEGVALASAGEALAAGGLGAHDTLEAVMTPARQPQCSAGPS